MPQRGPKFASDSINNAIRMGPKNPIINPAAPTKSAPATDQPIINPSRFISLLVVLEFDYVSNLDRMIHLGPDGRQVHNSALTSHGEGT